MAANRAIPDAGAIFDGVAENYERPAQVFGLGQYRYWQRELARIVATARPARVLDMCTGTGLIASEIWGEIEASVVGADLSREMLSKARRGDAGLSPYLVQADARRPPFVDGAFDAVVFSYLLRYVEDVPGTIGSLGELVRRGGMMASLEFGVPRGIWRTAWNLYTRAVLPAGLALVSPGWRRVGSFLGRSITEFYERWPVERQLEAWRDAGFQDAQTRSLSLGGGLIIWGTRC